MRDTRLSNSSSPVLPGADLSANLEYTVLENATVYKPGVTSKVSRRCSTLAPTEALRSEVSSAISSLQRVIAAKHALLHQDEDSEWDPVAWTTVDSQTLLQELLEVATALDPFLSIEITPDVAKAAVKAAADGTTWIEQLAELALVIKGSWERLPGHQKQADYTPLQVVCIVGLMLVRLLGSATACTTGVSQQQAASVLRQLSSKPSQQLLQESIAGHLFIFRWHEDPNMAADLDAVMLRKSLTSVEAPSEATEPDSSIACSNSTSQHKQPAALPRLLSPEYVPAAHRAWTRSFMLPLLPSADYWRSGQEVLLGWQHVCSMAAQLGLPVLLSSESFMLALEAFWLFAQPAGSYLPPNTAPQPAAAATGPMQLLSLWPGLLARQVSHLEVSLSVAPAAAVAVHAGAGQQETGDTAGGIQSGLIIPAASLLFGMLGEALQLLSLQWQQEPAAARAACIRAAIASSGQPVMARQKKTIALLGKAKPKAAEVACGQMLMMVKQLALLLTELLQLERSVCGGLQRDGTLPTPAESGTEAAWFSSLWRWFPRGSCQALELLLRCPTPACEPTTTLIELLLDDMWEALKALPVLQERETAKAVTAAVVSSQKVIRLYQTAIANVMLGSPTAAAAVGTGSVGGARGTSGGAAGSKVRHGRSSRSFTSNKGSAGKGQQHQKPAAAAAAGGHDEVAAAAAVPPAWLIASAEGDVLAALGAGLTLLYRVLDCAQKAYYWRWYTWWDEVRQQQQGDRQDQAAAAVLSTSSASMSSAVWSSSSFLSTSTNSSLDADDQNDELINAAIEGASMSSSSANSSDAGGDVPAAAPAAAGVTANCCSTAALPIPSAPATANCWGDGAVLMAMAYTALAAPCFQFVDAVMQRGFASWPEAQRLQQQEATMTLLENVSAGLSANSLILVELNRLDLLPICPPGSAAATHGVRSCLNEMLSSALAAANKTRAVPAKPAHAAAAAMRGAPVVPPKLDAALDVYDDYWQALAFEAVDQLRLSKALAGIALSPVCVAAVGCHNPACCNLSGISERRLVTLACRACRQVAYCSRSCQAEHWKAEGSCHRAECKDLQEAQQAEWLLPCEQDFGMDFETE